MRPARTLKTLNSCPSRCTSPISSSSGERTPRTTAPSPATSSSAPTERKPSTRCQWPSRTPAMADRARPRTAARSGRRTGLDRAVGRPHAAGRCRPQRGRRRQRLAAHTRRTDRRRAWLTPAIGRSLTVAASRALRIQEALALAEPDLDNWRGSILVRAGRGGRRREVVMDEWGWEQLRPWLTARLALPVGPLFCITVGPTRGRSWSGAAVRTELWRSRSALAKRTSGSDGRDEWSRPERACAGTIARRSLSRRG